MTSNTLALKTIVSLGQTDLQLFEAACFLVFALHNIFSMTASVTA